AAAPLRERVGQHDDHFTAAGRDRGIGRLRQVDELDVGLSGRRVAVQEVHDGIAAIRLARIARREVDEYVAGCVVAAQVAVERRAVHADLLELAGGGLCDERAWTEGKSAPGDRDGDRESEVNA